MEKEVVKTIAIDPDAHAKLLAVCKGRGVDRTLTSTVSSLVRWFCKQAEPVRRAVTDDIADMMAPAYADMLEHIADQVRQQVVEEVNAKRLAKAQQTQKAEVEIRKIGKDSTVLKG